MSVPATDLLTADAGVPADATAGMALLDQDVMPEPGADLEPAETEALDGVAPEPEPTPDEDPAVVEMRATLDAEIRKTLTQELNDKFEKDFANLRSTKDREVAQARDELMGRMAREQTLIAEFGRILQSYGIEQDQAGPQLELAIARVDRAEQAARRQQQATVATAVEIAETLDYRFQQRQEEAASRGELALDPLDPTVRQWRAWFTGESQKFFPGSLRAEENARRGLPVSAGDMHAYTQMQDAIKRMNDFESKHRVALTQKQATEKAAATARAQKAAKTRQENRGAQHMATGNGAGPMSDADIVAKAWELHPKDEAARLRFLRTSTPQPRR